METPGGQEASLNISEPTTEPDTRLTNMLKRRRVLMHWGKKRKSTPISHRFHIGKFSYLLKRIYNSSIDTHGTSTVIHSQVRSRKKNPKLSLAPHTFPMEVKAGRALPSLRRFPFCKQVSSLWSIWCHVVHIFLLSAGHSAV